MSVIANGAHLFGASALANSLQLGAANVASLDPASAFASGCESSYSLARGPLSFSQGGGGDGGSSTVRATRAVSKLLEAADGRDDHHQRDAIIKLGRNIERWWGWTEKGTELERVAAIHLLGRYVTWERSPRRQEGLARLVDELSSESASRRIAALFALDYSIYYLDRDSLLRIGRRLIERGECVPLAVWDDDGQKVEIDPSKFVHLRIASGLLGLCALSRDHEDPLVRFYDYIMNAAHTHSMDELGLERESELPTLVDPSETDFPIGDLLLDEWFKVYTSTPIEDMSTLEERELYTPLNELILQDDPYLRLAGYMGLQHVHRHIIGSSSALDLIMMRGLGDDDEMVSGYVEGVLEDMMEVYARSLERYIKWMGDIGDKKEYKEGCELVYNIFLGLVYKMVELIKREDDPYKIRVRASLLGGITKALPIEEHARVVESLMEFVRSDADPAVRASVVVALLQAAYSKRDPSPLGIDVETIIALSADEHAEIRAATVDGLFSLALDGILGEEDEVLRKVFIRLEGDESEIVRERLSYAKDVMAFE